MDTPKVGFWKWLGLKCYYSPKTIGRFLREIYAEFEKDPASESFLGLILAICGSSFIAMATGRLEYAVPSFALSLLVILHGCYRGEMKR